MEKISFNSATFKPSGLNTTFHGGGGSFQDYITHVQNFIRLARIDLTPENSNQIINANSPFEFRPKNPTKNGILLIHGLYDSPYSLRAIGRYFCERGFLVRSVLLPGNGTVPGDLTHVHYQDWIKATQYGVDSFRNEVEEVYLLGFSLGGALAIHYAILHPNSIKKLFLFAPALKSRRIEAGFLIRVYQLLSYVDKSYCWYQVVKQSSYARYECYPTNAAYQAYELMKETRKLTLKNTLEMPIFMALSADDESIDVKTVLDFFRAQKNPDNTLLLYTNAETDAKESKIIYRKSAFPHERIIDLAHTSLINPPEDVHYGKNGEFKDFQHYSNDLTKNPGEIYFGSILKKNLKKYVIQRLSFNPDFPEMLKIINNFLERSHQS